ncbi:MAG: xanthine dehydrogenase accessory protein XdhC [Pseudomonadota bacterium]
MRAVWVEITQVRGSSPRDAGTAMKVTEGAIEGTIGGGALEHRAVALARDMIASGALERAETFALGPTLGQCCGGAVTLRFDRTPRPVDPAPVFADQGAPRTHAADPLWIWGAGHVGRAVVAAADPSLFDITWIDDAPERFPADTPDHVTPVPAADMVRLAARAPHAHHLIFTYSHKIDFDLCAALLQRPAASIGLIGSATKRARFFRRLNGLGLDPVRITCPIGDKSLGKAPHQIAAGTLASLSERTGFERAS